MGTCYSCAAPLSDSAEFCPYCGMAAVPQTVPASVAAAGPPSTLSAPGPRLASPTVTLRPEAVRRPGPRTLLVLGAVVVLLLGGGVAYALLRPPGPSGTVSVERYFEALGDGDAAAALALVASRGLYAPEDYPLLDPKVLSDEGNRPTDVRVFDDPPRQEFRGTRVEAVRVSYRIGDTTVEQTILAGQTSDGEPYLLEEPFLRLAVDSPGGRRLIVNGVAVEAGDSLDTLVFPGAYTVTAEANALLAGDTRPASVHRTARGQPVAAVEFGPPALAGGAREAVETQVRQRIDSCALQTAPAPDGCPFSVWVFAEEVSVRWTVVAYPTVEISVEPSIFGDGQAVVEGSGGVVHYVATYTTFLGTTATESGDQPFTVHGSVSAAGSAITVSFR